MKREFLLNFKVGDQPLPKEVIDAIMAENGRDIEAAKKPFADYDTLKTQLETAQKTIPKQKSTLLGGFLFWWSRGESNPCPKVTWKELLRAQFVIYIPLLRREQTPYGV